MSDSARRTTSFSLDAYFERIGWEGGRLPDAATLRGVQLAHMRAIPFENLDALGGRAPSLDLADLTAKLVHGRRRGGYCYEHNTLFEAVPEALGVRVTRLAARVVVGADRFEDRPRTHMALLAELPGDPVPHLAGVGFGAVGSLLEPVPLVADTEFQDAGRRHRLVHAPHRGPLEMWCSRRTWRAPGRRSTPSPWSRSSRPTTRRSTGTSPPTRASPFSRRPFVQRLTPDAHLLLDGDRVTVTRTDDGTVTERKPADEAEARRILAEEFGIDVPEGLTLLR